MTKGAVRKDTCVQAFKDDSFFCSFTGWADLLMKLKTGFSLKYYLKDNNIMIKS